METLSLSECKRLLDKSGISYTEKEIKLIRDFLYRIGEIGYQIYMESHTNSSIDINYLTTPLSIAPST
jgi:hypothetical protein